MYYLKNKLYFKKKMVTKSLGNLKVLTGHGKPQVQRALNSYLRITNQKCSHIDNDT
jgi:hypothetical protein